MILANHYFMRAISSKAMACCKLRAAQSGPKWSSAKRMRNLQSNAQPPSGNHAQISVRQSAASMIVMTQWLSLTCATAFRTCCSSMVTNVWADQTAIAAQCRQADHTLQKTSARIGYRYQARIGQQTLVRQQVSFALAMRSTSGAILNTITSWR